MPQRHAVAKESPSEDPLTVIGATPRPGNDKLKRTRRHAGGESIATRDERIDPKLASHGGATGIEALCVDVGATDAAQVQCAPGHNGTRKAVVSQWDDKGDDELSRRVHPYRLANEGNLKLGAGRELHECELVPRDYWREVGVVDRAHALRFACDRIGAATEVHKE